MYRWLSGQLEQQFQIVKVLKTSDTSEVSVLRHRKLGKDIVRRVYRGSDRVYRILQTLSHVNLPRVYEVVSDGERVLVLEEYIDGITISEALEAQLYSEKAASATLRQICDGLWALHQLGIVHRDIKPENVMISSEGKIKLIDFDVSRVVRPGAKRDTEILGTVGYAAPEQFGITASDGRTDIFALGVLLNVMLTGEHPVRKLCDGRLAKIVQKCTAIDPNRRYRDVAELVRHLPY